nr:tripartite motif-containing protein 3-like [Cherax quadricarinatus]
MEEELTCSVCSEIYSAGSREPVVLPLCGHTFCRQCVHGVTEARDGVLQCPTCRTPHPHTPLHHLPTVYALLNLSETYRRSERGVCNEHGSPLEFWCRGCQKSLCGHCLLDAHLQDGHTVVLATVFIEERKRDIQSLGTQLVQGIQTRTDSVIGGLVDLVKEIARGTEVSRVLSSSAQMVERILTDTAGLHSIDSVLVSSTLMESLQTEVQRISTSPAPLEETPEKGNRKTRCISCSLLETSLEMSRQVSVSEAEWQETSLDEAEQTPHPDGQKQNTTWQTSVTSSQETNTSQEILEGGGVSRSNSTSEGEAVEGSDGAAVGVPKTPWPLRCCVLSSDNRTGELRTEQDRLHLHALKDNCATTHFVIHMSLLESLINEKPEVFLDIGVDGKILGRVYILLYGHLRRAQHFLALCLGTFGPSYRDSKFHGVVKPGAPGETLAGGKYVTPEGLSVQGLMEDLEWGGKCIREKTVGLVVGASGGKPELDAFFHICTREDRGKKFACVFGEVVRGIEVLHDAVKHVRTRDVTVVDVGVVIPNSRRHLNYELTSYQPYML